MKLQQSQDPGTWKFLTTGAVDIVDRDNLMRRIAKGDHLNVKLGLDPTRPDIHLGHTVVLRALRRFQDHGHNAILIIGDTTARIGDPSGQDKTRPPLTKPQVNRAAKTYLKQVWKILDKNETHVRWQSTWFDPMRLEDVVELMGKATVAQLLAREDFSNRYHERRPIHLQELLYPLLQAYDSVMVQADLELGGTDQKFNLLMGRDIQVAYGQPPQDIMTFPLLEGTDGRKMSKSLDNYIGISEPARVMFRKVMAIPDNLIVPYFELATSSSPVRVNEEKDRLERGENPRDAKERLAKTLVTEFYSPSAASQAANYFRRAVQQRLIPPKTITRPVQPGRRGVAKLFLDADLVKSISEAQRLISQKGLWLDDELVTSPFDLVIPRTGMTLRRGRHNAVDLLVLS